MLHLFIDTNVFLRFYAYADDALAEVDKLTALVKAGHIRLYVTEQVIDERAKHRDKELAESIKRLREIGSSNQIPRFAEHHESAKTLIGALKEVKKARDNLISAIREEMKGIGLRADQVIQSLFEAGVRLKRTPEILARARLRRELGNPPGKDGSLGDQINWELLLEHVEHGSELHLISRDKDFSSLADEEGAHFFLTGEWNFKKSSRLRLYTGLSDFTQKNFSHISIPSESDKAAAIESLILSTSFQKTHLAIALIAKFKEFLTKDDKLLILSAAVNNSQIGLIIEDEDMASFYKNIYDTTSLYTSQSLDDELYALSPIVFETPF